MIDCGGGGVGDYVGCVGVDGVCVCECGKLMMGFGKGGGGVDYVLFVFVLIEGESFVVVFFKCLVEVGDVVVFEDVEYVFD